MQKDKIQFFKSIFRGFLLGGGFFLGFFSTALLAVAVNGTIKTWTSGETLYASDLNTTINSLKTAIEGIPNWTKNGSYSIYNDGNVGIGTSNPTGILEVSGGGGGTATIKVSSSTNTDSVGMNIVGQNKTWEMRVAGASNGNSFSDGSFYFHNGTTAPFLLSGSGISTNGTKSLVWINTGATDGNPPSSGTTQTGVLRIKSGSNAVLDFGQQSTGWTGSWIQSTDQTGLNANYVLAINPNGGSVGIGTTAPDQLLSVNGNASKTGGTSWSAFSDIRLKESIKQYDIGLEEIIQINPITFKYKKDNELKLKSNGEQVGISAQELQKIIPDSVKKSSKDYLQFQMDYVNWAVVNSIKELKNLLDNEKSKTTKLEKELEKLSSRYASLLDDHSSLKKEFSRQEKLNKQTQLSFEARLKKLEGMNYAKK